MNRYGLEYEPPKTRVYRFFDDDRILTDSSNPIAYYAAEALNEMFGDINTTVE